MWTYRQSTGELMHLEPGANPLTQQTVGVGYAGGNIPPHHDPTAVNNPARQFDRMYGPLPQGRYTIGTAHADVQLGPVAMRLTQDPANVMHGRDGFFMHGDSVRNRGQASEGCIVMSMTILSTVSASNDRELTVIA